MKGVVFRGEVCTSSSFCVEQYWYKAWLKSINAYKPTNKHEFLYIRLFDKQRKITKHNLAKQKLIMPNVNLAALYNKG